MARWIYRVLLRLHPEAFRERFGAEMLWIFDESVGDTGSVRMIADVLWSLMKQHVASDRVACPTAQMFRVASRESLPVMHVVRASALASLALVGFLLLLQQSVPLPRIPGPAARRVYQPDVCTDFRPSLPAAHTLKIR